MSYSDTGDIIKGKSLLLQDSTSKPVKTDFRILLSEKYSTFGKEIYYTQPPDQNVLLAVTTENSFAGNIQHGFRKFVQEIFLPQGYPNSVSADYTQYQIWDTAQAFCSTITGTLATHAVMKGVGVGDVNATPLAATITWVLKEGTGNVGRIAFAWWKGTSLDADSKKWRLAADCLNDAAICLELALPLFSGYTTYVLCISTAMKSIVGVAGGATRAALTQHQAIRGNLADVAAKDGSQETAVNLIASFAAIAIISLVGQKIWPVFFIFTAFHLISNYCGVSSVCLDTFNSTRFHYATLIFLQYETVLPPNIVNSQEPVFFLKNTISDRRICGYKIKIGDSLKSLVQSGKVTLQNMEIAVDTFQDSGYLILFDMPKKVIYIILEERSTSEDILCGYFNAIIFGIIISTIKKESLMQLSDANVTSSSSNLSFHTMRSRAQEIHTADAKLPDSPSLELYREVQKIAATQWDVFSEGLRIAGWNLDKNLIISQEWRANWKYGEKDGQKRLNDLIQLDTT